ncbi:MAG: hypothetical protein KDK30_08955 [Leptospiraceae bacterium]|nr:hypothetical protein [Leptospiraceae bacterium]MCB1315663.1 hypothetical protein [Leptospiraceae bacterium]
MRTNYIQFICCLLVALSVTRNSQAGEWNTAPTPVRLELRPTPLALYPKVQRDAHSCGYLALAAIYESYGIDVRSARLRERIGTDEPAIPFLTDSNGTIQPDLFRVLEQDGFIWRTAFCRRLSERTDWRERRTRALSQATR